MTYQLALVANVPCFALVRVGKVSPMRIHTPGAQVMAYPKMHIQALTIITTTKLRIEHEISVEMHIYIF